MRYGLVITLCVVVICAFLFTGIAITQDDDKDDARPSPLQIAQKIRRAIDDLEDKVDDLESRVTNIEEAILSVEDEEELEGALEENKKE